eukprot:GDKI01039097.1.p1 GENE.GDKI01039097.1~~GDKI01039097.1.p1  ORF type:complete len:193 (-),score=67.58 GDKI01039097.1:109-687(-)
MSFMPKQSPTDNRRSSASGPAVSLSIPKTQAKPAGLPPKRNLKAEEEAQIQRAFELFDQDGSGEIEFSEIETRLRELGFDANTQQAVNRVLANVDSDGSKKIDSKEFYKMMTSKLSKKDGEAEINRAFLKFDNERKGFITHKDLIEIAEQLGETVSDDYLRDMIMQFAKSKEGQQHGYITFEEFKEIMETEL